MCKFWSSALDGTRQSRKSCTTIYIWFLDTFSFSFTLWHFVFRKRHFLLCIGISCRLQQQTFPRHTTWTSSLPIAESTKDLFLNCNRSAFCTLDCCSFQPIFHSLCYNVTSDSGFAYHWISSHLLGLVSSWFKEEEKNIISEEWIVRILYQASREDVRISV